MEDKLRVLILEDQNLVSVLMEIAVEDTAPSDVFIFDTIASASKAIEKDFDLALLDIDLTDGLSYDIARTFQRRNIPFTFVSGMSPQELPDELRSSPFIQKPFRDEEIRSIVREAYQRKNGIRH